MEHRRLRRERPRRASYWAFSCVLAMVLAACTTPPYPSSSGGSQASEAETDPEVTIASRTDLSIGPPGSHESDEVESLGTGEDTSATTDPSTSSVRFPFGVYTKFFGEIEGVSRSFDDPEFTEQELVDRVTTIMSTLAADGFTTVVTPKHSPEPGADATRFTTYDPDFRLLRLFLDTAADHELGVIHRLDPSDKPQWAWDHPANEAFLVRDEPKNESQLAAVQAGRAVVAENRPDLPTLTAVIGEQLDAPDVDAAEFWLERVWNETSADPRLVRFYPIRNDDDLLSQSSSHRDDIPTREFFGLLEQAADTPYWYIPQAFGAPNGGYFSLPQPAELSGLVHLALANGARGVLTYELFPDADDGTAALWAMEPFGPAEDGLYQSLANLAGQAQANAELLLVHERADFPVTTDNPEVEAVPRIDPRTGAHYVYVVNLNTISLQQVTVTVDPDVHGARVADVLSGQVHGFTDDSITLSLRPGDGAFIDLSGS